MSGSPATTTAAASGRPIRRAGEPPRSPSVHPGRSRRRRGRRLGDLRCSTTPLRASIRSPTALSAHQGRPGCGRARRRAKGPSGSRTRSTTRSRRSTPRPIASPRSRSTSHLPMLQPERAASGDRYEAMRAAYLRVLVLASALAALAAGAPQSQTQAPAQVIKIGLLTDCTGFWALVSTTTRLQAPSSRSSSAERRPPVSIRRTGSPAPRSPGGRSSLRSAAATARRVRVRRRGGWSSALASAS